MRWRWITALMLMLLPLMLGGCQEQTPTIDAGELGQVRVFQPAAPVRGLVFVLSDAGGWSREFTRAAVHLRDRGLIVAGVDTASVLQRLRKPQTECINLREAFETTSQAIQKSAGLDIYRLPILAGSEEGATLALAGLWQAGPETFAGAATVNVHPTLATAMPLCAEPSAQRVVDAKTFTYPPPAQMFGWWRAAWTHAPTSSAQQFAAEATEATPPDGKLSPSRLLVRIIDPEAGETSADAAEPLALGNLTVVDLPGAPDADSAVVILSGDGGWRDLDRSLGELLADAGVHVIGIDCLRYFWSAKTPETFAADLDHLLQDLVQRTGVSRIALVGYSFGADVLPATYNRLGADVRSRIALLSLLALGQDAHFEIHMEGWLGGNSQEDALPIGAELARIDPQLVQCIYGEEEAADSGCVDPHLHAAQVIKLPGGHHFDGDYAALAQRILLRLRQHS